MYRKYIASYLFVLSVFLGIHSFDLYAYNAAVVLCGPSSVSCGYVAVVNPIIAMLRGATMALAGVLHNAHQAYLKQYADKDDSFFTVMPDAVILADRFYYELRKNDLETIKQELLGVKNDLEKIRALYALSFTHQFLQKHAYDDVKNVKLLSVAQEKHLSDDQKSALRAMREDELSLLEVQIQEIQFLLAFHVNQLIDNVHHAETLYDDAISTIEATINVWNSNLNVMTHEIALRAYRHALLRENLVQNISLTIDELLAVINYYHSCTNACIEKSTNIITVLEYLAPAVHEKRLWIAEEKDIVRNNIAISEQYCAQHNISTISLKNEATKEFEKQKKARAGQVLQKVEMALSSSGFGGGPEKNSNKNNDDKDDDTDDDEQPFGKYEDASYHHKNSTGAKSVSPDNGQDALNRSIASTNQNSKRRYGVSESGQYVVFDETSPRLYHGHVVSWNELSKVKGLQRELIKQEMASKFGKAIYKIAKKIIKR